MWMGISFCSRSLLSVRANPFFSVVDVDPNVSFLVTDKNGQCCWWTKRLGTSKQIQMLTHTTPIHLIFLLCPWDANVVQWWTDYSPSYWPIPGIDVDHHESKRSKRSLKVRWLSWTWRIILVKNGTSGFGWYGTPYLLYWTYVGNAHFSLLDTSFYLLQISLHKFAISQTSLEYTLQLIPKAHLSWKPKTLRICASTQY